MSINRVNAVLPPADAAEIMTAMSGIKAKLNFAVNLSPEERRSLPKMGDKSEGFVRAALNTAIAHPEVLPGTFSLDEMRTDVALIDALQPIAQEIGELLSLIDDTLLEARSEAYTAALVVYHYSKGTSQGDALDKAADTMAQHFARKSRTETPTTPSK